MRKETEAEKVMNLRQTIDNLSNMFKEEWKKFNQLRESHFKKMPSFMKSQDETNLNLPAIG